MFRKFGWLLTIAAVVAMLGEVLALQLPTLRWPFNTARQISWQSIKGINLHEDSMFSNFVSDGKFPLGGWIFCLILLFAGIMLLRAFPAGVDVLPVVQRRIQRFKSVRRGYISLMILLGLVLLASMDHLLVGKRALMVKYDGHLYFPALVREQYKGGKFGDEGDAREAEASYRNLKERFEREGGDNWVLMPLVPFDPTGDTVARPVVELKVKEGIVYDRDGKLYDGLASFMFPEKPQQEHIRFNYRKGIRQGEVVGSTIDGKRVLTGEYLDGELEKYELTLDGTDLESFMGLSDGVLRKVYYHPAPPLPSQGHLLGTNSSGNDILAYLFGGLQVNLKAAVIYVPIIYSIGVTIGLLMGLFGGIFDLVVQRIIEMFSNIPFLFVVIIFSGLASAEEKGLGMILGILILFGWMGMTYLMRTAALREKARDYVAAARVSGASTPRIVFKHILPNTVAILVTLVPFSVSGIIMALTSLDYLGFGLPESYATWGRLLNDGLSRLASPWIVTSAFFMLVATLILVTFVGEAVRDAFDPKKFTTYK
ncbi:hypothetical protein Rhal01_02431 [Rubritalea halochordaticola]|uniref:ABC transmembrane type-1 domain-containing protein n=1 Tax=Rubritalea halochordaticola TaxID=714537 RepID=A0ABP9V0M8_9BACT